MDHPILKLLAAADIAKLKNSSKIADALEVKWARKIANSIESQTQTMLERLRKTGHIQAPDFEELFCDHFFDVSIRSTRYAMNEDAEGHYLPPNTGQAGKAAMSKKDIKDINSNSLADLMRRYDLYRRRKMKPRRPVAEAKALQDRYLKKVRSVWEKHSEDFRKGEIHTQKEIIEKVREEAETTISRAANIVRTETTNYYNKARKDYYDESQDITHYLFLAIRDAATSPWCSPLVVNGMRGRSGLVYAKSDPLCDKERPACHPGCRSEYLPLNRLNPAHLRFIQDFSLQRRNHECFPLLKNWKAA